MKRFFYVFKHTKSQFDTMTDLYWAWTAECNKFVSLKTTLFNSLTNSNFFWTCPNSMQFQLLSTYIYSVNDGSAFDVLKTYWSKREETPVTNFFSSSHYAFKSPL